MAGVTTTQVTVWLGGMAELTDNKVTVVLPFGLSNPAAGQLWLVLMPNFSGPGVMLLRLA